VHGEYLIGVPLQGLEGAVVVVVVVVRVFLFCFSSTMLSRWSGEMVAFRMQARPRENESVQKSKGEGKTQHQKRVSKKMHGD
jgi:hypothetical protein